MQKNEEGKKNSLVIWSIGIGILVLVVISIAFAASRKEEKDTSQTTQGSVAPLNPSDQVKGTKDGKLTLIEYSDFQCPACGTYYPIVKQIQLDYKDLLFVYRNFPLKSLHQNAENAAHAAEAAGRQDKFWEMHDLLFERQKEWSDQKDITQIFDKYAQELKLDVKKFEQDRTSQEVKKKIEADSKSGSAAQVQATPTFFLNGKKIEAPRGYDEFRQVIEGALKK